MNPRSQFMNICRILLIIEINLSIHHFVATFTFSNMVKQCQIYNSAVCNEKGGYPEVSTRMLIGIAGKMRNMCDFSCNDGNHYISINTQTETLYS